MTVEYLKCLIKKKEEIGKQIVEAMKGTFPIGHVVDFQKRGGFITAEIIEHGDFW